MPYFKWRGVNLRGQIRSGTLYAQTGAELDTYLFAKDIALLSYKPFKVWFSLPITLKEQIDFFSRLAFLLKAGILVPEALSLIAAQTSHLRFQEILQIAALQVKQGVSLAQALQAWPHLFDSVAINMIAVGQESGALAQAIEHIAQYLEAIDNFRNKIKAALFMPAITLLFFIVISIVLLLFMVPHFAQVFSSLNKPLPYATQLLLHINAFMHDRMLIGVLIAIICIVMALYMLLKNKKIRYMIDYLIFYIPVVGQLIIYQAMVTYFQALALLVDQGMGLVEALHTAAATVNNAVLRTLLEDIRLDVQAGSSLSQTFMSYDITAYDAQVAALIGLAHESGSLAPMLLKAAELYKIKAQRILSAITTLIQPFLLLVLGILITALIFAIYMPLIDLSYAV